MLNMYERCRRKTVQVLDSETHSTPSDKDVEDPEHCEICDAMIPFDDFAAACCINGHQFSKLKVIECYPNNELII